MGRSSDDMPREGSAAERGLARRRRPVSGDIVSRAPGAGEDPDLPQEEDVERLSGVTVRCPACGTEIYDDVVLCWNCGHAVGAAGSRQPPTWVILVVLAVVAGMLALLL